MAPTTKLLVVGTPFGLRYHHGTISMLQQRQQTVTETVYLGKIESHHRVLFHMRVSVFKF